MVGSHPVGQDGEDCSWPARESRGFRPRFFLEGEPSDPGATGPGATEAGAVPEADFVLGAEDSHHALKVLRVREGDRCDVVTPSGLVYAATVSAVSDPVCVRPVALLGGAAAGAVYRTRVGLVQALGRPSVMDYAIEKGTEVGACFFLLVPAAGSTHLPEEAKADRLVRWRRIAREAAKQSKQTVVPPVDIADSVGDGMERLAGSGALTVILDPRAPDDLSNVLRAILTRREPPERGAAAGERPCVALWVGPEGGWTEVELRLLSAAGAAPARLGQSVLRTETAGPVAVAVARLELGDW